MMKKKSIITKFDFLLTVPVVLIIGAGLLALYSSTHPSASSGTNVLFYKQMLWISVGLFAMLIMMFVPLKVIHALSYHLYILSVILLVAVLFIGIGPSGATRWIHILGFNFQPSEFAKIATILALSRFLADSKVSENKIRDLFVSFVIVSLPIILIREQPDLGTSLVFAAFFVPLLFWAEIPKFSLFMLVAPLISLIIMLIAPSKIYIFAVWIIILTIILYIAKKGAYITILNYIINLSVGISAPLLWNKLKPYQQNRIKNFLNPELDPRGAGYQILQSKTAIGSGGASGKGFLQGTQSQLRFLPQQHTDFIFSVFGEEFGFLGVICVLILYFFIILHGITIAVIAKNRFAGLVAIGISSIIFIHVFVNISMTVGLLPVTGLPLPFMSYGGSAMISFLAMIGILINISVNKLKY